MQSGEGILNNKFGITDRKLLDKIEFDIVLKRLDELKEKNITGNLDYKHLINTHQHIFQDIYPWAGTLRDGGYSRKNRVLSDGTVYIVEYSYSDYLEHNLKKELGKLKEDNFFTKCKNKEEFCNKLGNLYKDLDFLHPFAEGNSRTLREFTRQIGVKAGFNIKWNKTYNIKDELYIARDLGVNNNDGSKLINILHNIVEPAINITKVKKKDKDYSR